MFKENSGIFLYLLGILIMFGILITVGNNMLPFLFKGYFVKDDTLIAKPKFTIDTTINYSAVITTNYGEFTIDLLEKSAPQNVNNFIYLAKAGYYKNTKFHRVIRDFLIQGGDRNTLKSDTSNYGKGKPGYLLPDEVNWDSLDLTQAQRDQLTQEGYASTSNLESIKLDRMTIAMASAGPNTNGSQFFIVTSLYEDPRLDELQGRFTVFGKIISGVDTIEKINDIEVDTTTNIPLQDVVIVKIQILPESL
jgi:cyclophilin family peptidyl-prolyl cis-trans isomerase